jgi:DNA invertase Pin-like site-specific DNA recombinase
MASFFEAIDQGLKILEKKDPMNDFMLVILGAAAQFERELISERVRDGMARAKSEHKKIGRPNVLEKKGIDISKLVKLKESGK